MPSMARGALAPSALQEREQDRKMGISSKIDLIQRFYIKRRDYGVTVVS